MTNEALEKIISGITRYQHASGAYPASPQYPAYAYSWFRDGSFTADAMSRAGQIASAERFFAWGASVITARREIILAGGRLDTRYTYDGHESGEEWADFQLDGFGIFLWAVQAHARRHDRSIAAYQEATGLLQHYLVTHWQEPSFDWWEERQGLHAASLACIYAGLSAFDHPEATTVRAAITFDEERIDASLLICGLFDAVDRDTFRPVLAGIEVQLKRQNGGVYRYADDTYYGGGQWPVLSALLGLYYLKIGQTAAAQLQLDWCVQQADEQYFIPEQSSVDVLHRAAYDDWLQRAGPSARPLLWSHAMVVTLATKLQR